MLDAVLRRRFCCLAAALPLGLSNACHRSPTTPEASPDGDASAHHAVAPDAATDVSRAAALPPHSVPKLEHSAEPSSTPTIPSGEAPLAAESDALPMKLPDVCAPRESPELARQDLREANEWITRAGEHPMESDLARIIPRLQRAAYAGNVEAQVRFGEYVVGYYITDEMFWPRQHAVAIAALAMLRVAARRGPPNPKDSLLVALASDPPDFSKLNGLPPLPRAWVRAALAEARRWERCP